MLCVYTNTVLVIPQVRLMISDSELSDDFSLDTVGSHGHVKCKGRYKDYLVRRCYLHGFFLFPVQRVLFFTVLCLTLGWSEDWSQQFHVDPHCDLCAILHTGQQNQG